MDPAPVHPTLSLVQTDAFCDCGYNLHGQRVWRDLRLEILVCRCPECGRHSAAGRFTGIHSAWLSRLSVLLAMGWFLLLTASLTFLTFFLWLWPTIHTNAFTHWQPIPASDGASTRYAFVVDYGDAAYHRHESRLPFIVTWMALDSLAGFGIGLIVAAGLLHLSRWKAGLFLCLPILVAPLVYLPWWHTSLGPGAQRWIWIWIGWYTLVGFTSILVAQLLGRRLARAFFGLLLPPRLLQYFLPLWTRDGKTPPFQAAPSAGQLASTPPPL